MKKLMAHFLLLSLFSNVQAMGEVVISRESDLRGVSIPVKWLEPGSPEFEHMRLKALRVMYPPDREDFRRQLACGQVSRQRVREERFQKVRCFLAGKFRTVFNLRSALIRSFESGRWEYVCTGNHLALKETLELVLKSVFNTFFAEKDGYNKSDKTPETKEQFINKLNTLFEMCKELVSLIQALGFPQGISENIKAAVAKLLGEDFLDEMTETPKPQAVTIMSYSTQELTESMSKFISTKLKSLNVCEIPNIESSLTAACVKYNGGEGIQAFCSVFDCIIDQFRKGVTESHTLFSRSGDWEDLNSLASNYNDLLTLLGFAIYTGVKDKVFETELLTGLDSIIKPGLREDLLKVIEMQGV
ncbi:hypothetical protein KAW80_00535 [Candidatus Babeliales bacterium]|nr:hypothetical protein [Candidatus Babeliales bacterium]